jgi:hypothetical protein
LFQPFADVPLLVDVDGGGRRHQRGLLRHRQEKVLRHQLLVRLRQVENLSRDTVAFNGVYIVTSQVPRDLRPVHWGDLPFPAPEPRLST